MKWSYNTQYLSASTMVLSDFDRYNKSFKSFHFQNMLDVALEVLIANGITNVTISTSDLMMNQKTRYQIFVYGVEAPFKSVPFSSRKEYSHALAVVLDNETRSCYLINSLASVPIKEKTQLETMLSLLPDYQVKMLTSTSSLDADINAAQNTIANIISLINGDINLETGEGVFEAGQDYSEIANIFAHALATINKKISNEDELIRTFRVKKALITALYNFSNMSIHQEVDSLCVAINEDIKLINREQDAWKQRMLPDFMRDFIEKNPENSVARMIGVNFYDELPGDGDIKTIVTNHLTNKFTGCNEQPVEQPMPSSSMDPVTPAASSSTRSKPSFFSPEFPNHVNEAKNKYALSKALIIASRSMSSAMKHSLQAFYEILEKEIKRDTDILRDNPKAKVKPLGVFLSDFFQANPDNQSSTLFTHEAFSLLQKELQNIPSLVEKNKMFENYFNNLPELQMEESTEPGRAHQ